MFKVRLYFRIRLSMFMHYLYTVFMHFLLKLSYMLFRMGLLHLIPPLPQGCKGPGKNVLQLS